MEPNGKRSAKFALSDFDDDVTHKAKKIAISINGDGSKIVIRTAATAIAARRPKHAKKRIWT